MAKSPPSFSFTEARRLAELDAARFNRGVGVFDQRTEDYFKATMPRRPDDFVGREQFIYIADGLCYPRSHIGKLFGIVIEPYVAMEEYPKGTRFKKLNTEKIGFVVCTRTEVDFPECPPSLNRIEDRRGPRNLVVEAGSFVEAIPQLLEFDVKGLSNQGQFYLTGIAAAIQERIATEEDQSQLQ